MKKTVSALLTMLALRNSVSTAERELLGLAERPLIPSAEQGQVVDAVADALARNANGEGVIKISVPGVAGASKTTTLKMVNDRVGSLNGRKGIFSLSKSAVGELKTRMAHEVDKIGTVHSRYFSTLNDLYRGTWGPEALMKLGIDEGSAKSHATVSYDGSTNYVLLQHLLVDRTAAPPRPSVEYQLAGTFVVQLYDKAQLHGFGLPGQPAMDDADALRRLVVRYNLAHKLERKFLDGNSVQCREFTALVGEDSTEARLAHGISLVPRLHELAAEAAVNPKALGATDMLNFARPAHHISLPCVNYTGMIYHVLLNERRVLGFDGHPFRLVFVDEANDNSILISLAVLNMLSPSTVLVSFGDKNQRICAPPPRRPATSPPPCNLAAALQPRHRPPSSASPPPPLLPSQSPSPAPTPSRTSSSRTARRGTPSPTATATRGRTSRWRSSACATTAATSRR